MIKNQSRILYAEWLPLDKSLFCILVMLADLGEFQGNLSDVYRYLNPAVQTVQTKQRERLKEAIETLSQQGFLNYQKSGNTYHLSLVPQQQGFKVPQGAITALRTHRYSSESVAWEQVLKVYLWICRNDGKLSTNAAIAADLNISESTVVCAKNVLKKEFNAIDVRNVSIKLDDESFLRIGQELNGSAWWENI